MLVARAADQGRQLEQLVAEFFARNGYTTRCNQVIEGRSGGSHEIDVLAEKADALTTFRLGVECKAWQQPIEKDVVSKLHYVVGDLGLSKGIVVSLAGSRAGAEQAAAALGIDLWGPDDLRRHLGDAVVDQLGAGPAPANATQTWGLRFARASDQAERTVRSSGKGRLGLRTLERLLFFSPVWLPTYCVRVTCTEPQVKRLKTRLRSTTVDNLYEALSGSYLGRVSSPWQEIEIEQRLTLRPTYRDTKVHSALRKAFSGYERVSSPAAVDRHSKNLSNLGIRSPCASLSIDSTSLVHLPFYMGVLEADGRQRVAAVAGDTGSVSESVSQVLTVNLPHLRSHFIR